ncbi:MAG TPA: TetR/AcrR family transcriptional regulator [Ruminococcus sp.]
MSESKIDIILNSAEELMYGISRPKGEITVDMIAKNAGIGKGSIYYYFKSKDEIIDSVIERCYTTAINEYFSIISNADNTFEKMKILFCSMLKEEFLDSSKNVLMALHLQDDIVMHYKMMTIAIKTISPILSRILIDGTKEGTVQTDSPKDSAEMMIAMLTLLLNNANSAADNESISIKLRLYAKILETCLKTKPGSFEFLYSSMN